MERITIRVSDRRKARLLRDFLKSLDYVDKVTIASFRPSVSSKAKNADFFAMAGIWAKRDITLDKIRQSAWPGRA
ncbi:MAG: hypothetical protein C4557_00190 [Anaerolineaceae bacterium]|jgi:hypothetical protein|nr:MAG: hypothetical protein C4557_00190 [Anaerolineaceae bacterium]